MNILSVELTTDESRSIIAQFVDQIETLTICQLDVLSKGKEIVVETELIDFVAQVQFFSEYDDCEMPNSPTLISQSVSCKMKAYNKQGTEIKFRVEPERYYNEIFKRMQTRTKIDIQEEIANKFTV